MHTESKYSFAFLVITFNHQDFILEHLESIKYLVKTYGSKINVDIIINDDCSSDQTRKLVDLWLAVNKQIFRHIKTIYNQKNIGTCASVNNMLMYMKAERCKLTAGDDVYSFENIFELTKYRPDEGMLSGRALYLCGNALTNDPIANTLATVTQGIYHNNTLLHRFKHFSYNNAANLLYATECLLNLNVRKYMLQFDVVEDWPLQLAIAREFPELRFKLIDQVLVYYRRTPGSTYIIANKRFKSDKNKIYIDLINNEKSLLERIRLISRKRCFNSNNGLANKILNIDTYFFLISIIFNLNNINKYKQKIIFDLELHQEHLSKIKFNSENFNK
jgi:glycosyltransferase involved in cell wall biosynthesis